MFSVSVRSVRTVIEMNPTVSSVMTSVLWWTLRSDWSLSDGSCHRALLAISRFWFLRSLSFSGGLLKAMSTLNLLWLAHQLLISLPVTSLFKDWFSPTCYSLLTLASCALVSDPSPCQAPMENSGFGSSCWRASHLPVHSPSLCLWVKCPLKTSRHN